MLRLLLPLLLLVALSGVSPAEEREPSAAVKALMGSYKIVQAENSGQKTPQDKIDGVTVRVTADAIVAEDKDNNLVYGATYTLDATEQPMTITMTSTMEGSKGMTAKGVLEHKGDQIRLLYLLPPREGAANDAEPPSTKPERREILVVLKKVM